MRRWCTAIVLAILVSGPTLQLRCAVSCAPEDRAQAPGTCPYHHHHTDGPVLTRNTDCCLDAVLSDSVATLVWNDSSVTTLPLTGDVTPPAHIPLPLMETRFAAAPHGRPPGSFGAPLRI